MLKWIVLVAAASVAAAQPPGGIPPAPVRLDAARVESVDQWREVTGELLALRRATLASRQEGIVLVMGVEDGQRVAKGQVIARLDDAHASLAAQADAAAVEALRGVVALRRAELDRALRDVERYTQLDTRGSASAQEVDTARTAQALAAARLVEAEGSLAQAQARLEASRLRLAEMTILAPFDARVVRKRTEVGQWVAIGAPVADVLALDQLEARLDVPESIAIGLVEQVSLARVRARAAGDEIEGPVVAIMPEVDALSRLVPVRVLIKNESERLRPGMAIVGLVRTGSAEQGLTVSKDAILRDDAGEFLFMEAGGVAVPVRVRTLFALRERVVIQGEIPPGAMIVVGGNERLFPGRPLMDMNASPRREE